MVHRFETVELLQNKISYDEVSYGITKYQN